MNEMTRLTISSPTTSAMKVPLRGISGGREGASPSLARCVVGGGAGSGKRL